MKVLQADDLDIGMYVTVLRTLPEPKEEDQSAGDGPRVIVMPPPFMMPEYCSALKGSPLLVMAKNLPFIVVKAMDRGMTIDIDTRRVDLMRVDEEYARALTKKPWWKFWS